MRRLVATAAALVLALSTAPSRAGTKTVEATNFRFSPAALAATAGDTIVWEFTAGTHNVTAYEGASFASGNLSQGERFEAGFSGGIVRYHCTLHSSLDEGGCAGMCGVIAEPTAPPVPTIVFPSDGAVLGPRVTVRGTVAAGADAVAVLDGDDEIGSVPPDPDGEWAIDLDFDDGEHVLRAVSFSPAGQSSAPSAPVRVTVDANAPAATIDSHMAVAVAPGELVISGGATDDRSVDAVLYTIDRVVTPPDVIARAADCDGCGTTTARWTARFDPPPGPHRMQVRAVDAAGNRSAVLTLLIVAA